MSITPENGISPTKVELAVAKNAKVMGGTVEQSLGKSFDHTQLPENRQGQHVVRRDGHAISGKRTSGHH